MFGLLTAIKTFIAGNTATVWAAAFLAVFLLGLGLGIKIQRTLYRAEQLAVYEAQERQRVYLVGELDKLVVNLKTAEKTIKEKNYLLKQKVRDASKHDPAYQCPVPPDAIELLNK